MDNRYTLVLRALVGAVCLCLSIARAAAGEPAQLDVGPEPFASPHGYGWYELLIDGSAQLAPREVLDSRAFGRADRDRINAGFTDAQVWARFTLHWSPARSASLALVLPKPLIDDVEFLAVADGEIVKDVLTGDSRPFASRPFGYRAFAFELVPRPGQTVTYLLRLRSQSSGLEVPLVLLETSQFRHLLSRENFWLGGYFGAMSLLAIAVVCLFLRLRQAVFLHYALYIASFTLMLAALSGYGMMLLWPAAGAAQQFLPTGLVTLAMTTGMLFIDCTLGLARWPRRRLLMAVLLTVAAVGSVVQVTGGSIGVRIVIAVAVLFCPLLIAQCLASMRAGDRFAGYFLAGWLCYIAGALATAFDALGLVSHSLFTSYGLYFGALAEFVFFTVIMSERMALANRAKETQIERTNAELAELNQNLESIVRHRTRELEERNRELADLAIRDSLTGLYNHSASIELLDQILHQSQRYDFPVTVVMVDIDHFKRVNDTYGHQVGDALLERMAHTLLESLRDSDIVGRYGGEEFLIAMPHADAAAAREFGERLLARARAIGVPRAAGEHLTISLGISVYHPYGQRLGAAEIIRRADEALYRSKRDGRDRLTVDNLAVVSSNEAPSRSSLS
ncbi:MAG: GGDEF domain-containing protein [Gammaproteobacteria bacterium]|nr:GGDEF domain-containing protein [Gammaproteobacteria bacterium]